MYKRFRERERGKIKSNKKRNSDGSTYLFRAFGKYTSKMPTESCATVYTVLCKHYQCVREANSANRALENFMILALVAFN